MKRFCELTAISMSFWLLSTAGAQVLPNGKAAKSPRNRMMTPPAAFQSPMTRSGHQAVAPAFPRQSRSPAEWDPRSGSDAESRWETRPADFQQQVPKRRRSSTDIQRCGYGAASCGCQSIGDGLWDGSCTAKSGCEPDCGYQAGGCGEQGDSGCTDGCADGCADGCTDGSADGCAGGCAVPQDCFYAPYPMPFAYQKCCTSPVTADCCCQSIFAEMVCDVREWMGRSRRKMACPCGWEQQYAMAAAPKHCPPRGCTSCSSRTSSPSSTSSTQGYWDGCCGSGGDCQPSCGECGSRSAQYTAGSQRHGLVGGVSNLLFGRLSGYRGVSYGHDRYAYEPSGSDTVGRDSFDQNPRQTDDGSWSEPKDRSSSDCRAGQNTPQGHPVANAKSGNGKRPTTDGNLRRSVAGDKNRREEVPYQANRSQRNYR